MENLASLSLGRKLALGAGLLLFIDTFLAWQKISILGISATANAWHGFWGVFLGLLTIAFILWVAAKAFGIDLPVPAPEGLVTLALGALVLLFALLKTLTESYRGYASWIGIILAAGAAGGAWLIFQDSGEVLPSMPARPAAGTPPPAPPAPPAPTDEPPSDPA
ncbi:MAG TPA: hypothetical protein VF379_01655 [Gaiellaceae bacterium]